jgi:hypothetical protein
MSPAPESSDDANTLAESTHTRRALLGAVAAAATAGLAGCAGSFVRIERAETTVERRFDATEVDRLRVASATDDVSVERSGGDTVRVRVHKRAHGQTDLSELGLHSRVEDGVLHLRTRKPPVVGVGGGSVPLEISVPESVSVNHVDTADGDIVVRDTAGDVVLETGDGDVVAAGVRGDVTAATDDGSVTIERVDGVVTARSSDGDVTVRDPGAVEEIRTDDGAVVAAVPAVRGTATVRSTDGSVTVTLGDAVDARVAVTTDDGQVTVANALDDVEATAENLVTGTVGDGTSELTIHSDDGDVTVTSRE